MPDEESDIATYLKRSGYILLLCNVVMFWNSFYTILNGIFLAIPNKYQILLGLMHPLVKELSFYNYYYLACKIGLQENSTIEIAWHSHMETLHALFLSVILGNIANTETSYCILAMDFITNVFNCLTIIYRIKFKDSMDRGKFESS